MVGKIAMTKECLGAGSRGEPGDLVRHQPEIGRHPDRTEPKRREHRPEHLVAILGMDQDAIAPGDAARGQRRRQRRDEAVDLAPGPRLLAPDEADALAMAAGILRQEMREIHHPARHRRHAAGWRGRGYGPGHRLTSALSTHPPPAAPPRVSWIDPLEIDARSAGRPGWPRLREN